MTINKLLLLWSVRFLIDRSKGPIVTAPRSKVDIDECHFKCGTVLKLFRRSANYPHSCELLLFSNVNYVTLYT